MSRVKRSTSDYLAAMREMAVYVPSLRKYKRRKKNLKPQEKAVIARFENVLQYAHNLQPVTKKQAKVLKNVLYSRLTPIKKGKNKGKLVKHGGVQAIQLSNTGEKVSLKVVNKNLFVTTNGRTWVYQRLSQISQYDEDLEQSVPTDESLEEIEEAGETVFKPTIREAFPVEKIIRLAEKAFAQPEVKMVGLWAIAGRVGSPFVSLKEFVYWIYNEYSQYKDVERWVNGIAILIADVGEKIPAGVWNKTSERAKRQRKYRAKQRARARR